MRKISVDEVKQIELALLKYTKEICEKNNIEYFLGYGTLLGAVRHKGFIPWDDDVDVVLLREEYNKLIRAVEEDNHEYIKVFHMGNSDCYLGPYAMIVDTRTFLKHDKVKKELIDDLGVYIDVFPLDKGGDIHHIERLVKKSYQYKAMNNLTMVTAFDGDSKLKILLKQLVAPLANIVGHKKWCQKIERLAEEMKTEVEQEQYAADLMWEPRMNWVIPLKAYENSIMLPFEDDCFNAPADYELVLRTGYGDYMQLPPVEERITGHYYDYYWKE